MLDESKQIIHVMVVDDNSG